MRQLTVLLLAALLILAGCGTESEKEGEGEAGVLVYASVYPLYDFTQKIAGDHAQVMLLATGGEPHDWEPTTGDMVALERADVLIYNGAGLEYWVDSVLDSLSNDKLLVVQASAPVTLLHGDEDNDHDGEDGHDHDGADPHVWLSPRNAKLQLRAITDALVLADEAHAADYEENYRHWAEQLDQLDREYLVALAPYAGRKIVVAHQAFGYLCQAYGLEQIGVRGFSPDAEPDPARMARIVDYVREQGVGVIFFEQAADPGAAETIARETGVRTGILHPIEALSAEELAAGEDYFSLMRANLEAIVDSFI